MFCTKCGAKNRDDAKFCQRCGTPMEMTAVRSYEKTQEVVNKPEYTKARNAVGQQNAVSSDNPNQTKLRIIIAVILVAVATCIIGLTVYLNHQKTADYSGKLQTAEKYMEKMDYKRAEAAYLQAINIQPKNEDTYLKLADAYIAQKDYSKAIEILNSGKEQTGSKKIAETLKEVKREEKAKSAERDNAYYELCKHYQERYGEPGYQEFDTAEDGKMRYKMTGLCVVKLFDFDRDGNRELILGYLESEDDFGYNAYAYEVWAWVDGELKNVFKRIETNYNHDVGKWIETASDGRSRYLVSTVNTENIPGTWETFGLIYWEYKDGKFTEKYSWKAWGRDEGDVYRINNKDVSFEEGERQKKDFPTRVPEQDIYSGRVEYNIEREAFRIELQYLPKSYAAALLADTEKNLELVK